MDSQREDESGEGERQLGIAAEYLDAGTGLAEESQGPMQSIRQVDLEDIVLRGEEQLRHGPKEGRSEPASRAQSQGKRAGLGGGPRGKSRLFEQQLVKELPGSSSLPALPQSVTPSLSQKHGGPAQIKLPL